MKVNGAFSTAAAGHTSASPLVLLTLGLAHPEDPGSTPHPPRQPDHRITALPVLCPNVSSVGLHPSRAPSFYLCMSWAWRRAWHQRGLSADLVISSASAIGGGGLCKTKGGWGPALRTCSCRAADSQGRLVMTSRRGNIKST